jgi:hypothetical protein
VGDTSIYLERSQAAFTLSATLSACAREPFGVIFQVFALPELSQSQMCIHFRARASK